ncbi:hypothetical protein K493DRAFT_311897 [Basidiobolus meristosporus CBS 931.73]|uniref:Uncharacterized protein n=1 Tax=Basidiobolus meristosporus CBS 931.73 TaxID=1314790 RepID=A0A1Y1YY98_9FUNG|nr:hypothetical protein K493DRAFT_311897 [Basidiobolus meristosporus CBS 931.73]|eukprot:ORY03008.1 hypothetical protein K493DRAFT_311897 [Basidiobolus meristosporus CBS 931.73]
MAMGLEELVVTKRLFRNVYDVRRTSDDSILCKFQSLSQDQDVLYAENGRDQLWQCTAQINGVSFHLSSEHFQYANVKLNWEPRKFRASFSYESNYYTWVLETDDVLRCYSNKGVTIAMISPTYGMSIGSAHVYLPKGKPNVTSALISLLITTGFRVLQKAEWEGLTFHEIRKRLATSLEKDQMAIENSVMVTSVASGVGNLPMLFM